MCEFHIQGKELVPKDSTCSCTLWKWFCRLCSPQQCLLLFDHLAPSRCILQKAGCAGLNRISEMNILHCPSAFSSVGRWCLPQQRLWDVQFFCTVQVRLLGNDDSACTESTLFRFLFWCVHICVTYDRSVPGMHCTPFWSSACRGCVRVGDVSRAVLVHQSMAEWDCESDACTREYMSRLLCQVMPRSCSCKQLS